MLWADQGQNPRSARGRLYKKSICMINPFSIQHPGNKTNAVILESAVVLGAALVLAVAITDLNLSMLFLGLAVLISIITALNFPLIHLSVYIGIAVIWDIFSFWHQEKTNLLILIPGIRINEVFLGGMFMGLLLLIPIRLSSMQSMVIRNKRLNAFVIGFAALLMTAVVRNFGTYGLSAPGEFRTHYLILILPVYIAVILHEKKARLAFFKIFLFFSLFLPLFCLPAIGFIKGWGIGPSNRFYTASTALGILTGMISFLIGRQYGAIKDLFLPLWPVFFIAVMTLIFDSHRSVWFSGLIMIFVFFQINRGHMLDTRFSTILYLIVILTGITIASIATSSFLEIDLLDYIRQRGGEVFQVGYEYNNTWNWRIMQWKQQLVRIKDSPFIGLGFGGYWGLTGLPGDVGVSPHNLYVKILVKLGILGLCLYLVPVWLIFRYLVKASPQLKAHADPEYALLSCGLVALVGSHVFYMAYSFNFYCLIAIGLSVATIRYNVFRGTSNAP